MNETKPTQEENNKLIADFIGRRYNYIECDACGKIDPELDNPDSGSRITKCCPRSIGNYGKTYKPYNSSSKDLKYDTSWDWLMPVYMRCHEVAKIEEGEVLKVFNELFYGMLVFNNINWLYDACIEFVGWLKLRQKGVNNGNV